MESKHTEVEGHKVHYWEGGKGFPILMMHGVGPGTSIVGNFGPALEGLCERFHIFATDLIGFGGSDRKAAKPYFDVDLWVRQAEAILKLMPAGPVGVIGHSMGGALALKFASRNERVVKVMTSCTVGAAYPITEALNGFWTTPEDRPALRKAMSRMMFNPGGITDEMIEDRWKMFMQPGYPDYVASVFAEPRQALLDAGVLSDSEIAAIKGKVMMLHGRDDQPCPPTLTTLVLANKLPHADVHLLGNCGHNLPRERTASFLLHAGEFFA
jgi:2-hydroxymuconate-semialdehyde hydrolase